MEFWYLFGDFLEKLYVTPGGKDCRSWLIWGCCYWKMYISDRQRNNSESTFHLLSAIEVLPTKTPIKIWLFHFGDHNVSPVRQKIFPMDIFCVKRPQLLQNKLIGLITPVSWPPGVRSSKSRVFDPFPPERNFSVWILGYRSLKFVNILFYFRHKT